MKSPDVTPSEEYGQFTPLPHQKKVKIFSDWKWLQKLPITQFRQNGTWVLLHYSPL